MVEFEKNDDRKQQVIRTIAAVLRDAEAMADQTAAFLDQLGPEVVPASGKWPKIFLLEIGAVLRLRRWEVAGVKKAINPTLPKAETAFTALAEKLKSNAVLQTDNESELYLQVVQAWWDECAHPCVPALNVDIALKSGDGKKLISSLARLLWLMRDTPSPTDQDKLQ